MIQNGFKLIYGFEWTPRRRGGGRGGEGEGEAAIGICCLPSNSQILSQAALISGVILNVRRSNRSPSPKTDKTSDFGHRSHESGFGVAC